ncbi:MAG: cysteine rich repeat-containing protein [Hyphomicrobiales bacterium]|nr:cysteine rich repeat-containing protein [Hyphomicrobiales bacterium]
MQHVKIALMAVFLPLILAENANADWRLRLIAGGGLREGIRACGGDVARYCSRTVPGQGRMIQCLADSYDDLRPECQQYVDRTFDVRRTLFACTADAERLCPGMRPGGGRIAICLFEQEEDLSDECKNGVADIMGER